MELNKGPFTKEGDVVSDRELFAEELSDENEASLDNYMLIKKVNKEAKKELLKRNSDIAFESLMESFK